MKAVKEIQQELAQLANPKIASHSQRFFKTGPGEYGEGDQFRGIRVPLLRKLAKKYRTLELTEVAFLLQSPFHEDRMLALLILILRYDRGDEEMKEKIYQLYLGSTQQINNWDLVDTSAEHIVGAHLQDKNRAILYSLARSPLLWERRIAILSTFHYIKRDEFEETLKLAELLLGDREDLIHKAVGWMLREIGKRDLEVAQRFLKEHYRDMPRTMLRYAIERFPKSQRQSYLQGKI